MASLDHVNYDIDVVSYGFGIQIRLVRGIGQDLVDFALHAQPANPVVAK
jgi:hypothetical protein